MWTEQYAKPLDVSAGVAMLSEMGFDAAAAADALRRTNGDQDQALELLLAGS